VARPADEPFHRLLQLRLQDSGKHPDPEKLEAAFTALGLDRVVAGVRSLHMQGRAWHDCFLSMAYGDAGELSRDIDKRASQWGKVSKWTLEELVKELNDTIARGLTSEYARHVSDLLQIDVQHVEVIADQLNADPEGFTAALESWLQGRNLNAATVVAEARQTALELKCPFHICYSRHFVDPDSLKIP